MHFLLQLKHSEIKDLQIKVLAIFKTHMHCTKFNPEKNDLHVITTTHTVYVLTNTHPKLLTCLPFCIFRFEITSIFNCKDSTYRISKNSDLKRKLKMLPWIAKFNSLFITTLWNHCLPFPKLQNEVGIFKAVFLIPLLILRPSRIKIPKDAKKFMACVQ